MNKIPYPSVATDVPVVISVLATNEWQDILGRKYAIKIDMLHVSNDVGDILQWYTLLRT